MKSFGFLYCPIHWMVCKRIDRLTRRIERAIRMRSWLERGMYGHDRYTEKIFHANWAEELFRSQNEDDARPWRGVNAP